MQDIILKRWGIESRHWVIDVVFGQDALPLRNQDYTSKLEILCVSVIARIAKNVIIALKEAQKVKKA